MSIKQFIKNSGKKRAEIAAEVGISRPHLSRLEAGTCQVTPDHLVKLARVLNVKPRDLRPDLAAIFEDC